MGAPAADRSNVRRNRSQPLPAESWRHFRDGPSGAVVAVIWRVVRQIWRWRAPLVATVTVTASVRAPRTDLGTARARICLSVCRVSAGCQQGVWVLTVLKSGLGKARLIFHTQKILNYGV